MPNVACQIGAGMTAIALGTGAQSGDERLAVSIFSALGKTVMLDESLMHAATAVSGSGPAYIFLLAQAMEQAATELGIDAANARTMASQTALGAARLLVESDRGAADLRESVTSPGGTTAAAMDVFRRRQFTEMVIEALRAARDRGVSLDR
jgi:pyrroline-5-carboxylate reductase